MTLAGDSDFLLAMSAASHARDEAARASVSDAQLCAQLKGLSTPVGLHLSALGFDLIAEIKKRSPAEGELAGELMSPVDQARSYVQGGAAALSVLTEPERFDGSLDDLREIADHVPVPAMRKDFLISCYQVREARLAGAAGVLLIAAMLEQDQLKRMLETTLEHGMYALMEVFDPADLDKCVPVLESFGAAVAGGRCNYLLGVNCRDLRSLQVNFGHFADMAPRLPADMPWVAESGLTEAEHARTAASLGYRLALVGSALMRSGDPAATVKAFREAGQAACS